MKRSIIIALVFMLCFPSISQAQKFGVNTNLAYWATTTPNLGVEVALGPRVTFHLSGGYNPWTLNDDPAVNMKMKHFLVSPEFRYWFCNSFQGHFMGINANYAEYNVGAIPIPTIEGSENRRYEGWAAAAGLTYGYSWILGKRWNLEATIGLGCWYTEYDAFENRKCGLFQSSGSQIAFGPTRIGLSFIYMIK